MATVTLKNLSKRYSSAVQAVRGVDLVVPAGKVTVVVGASGSGKTTLLRLIAGLETPTAGDILIDDQSVASIPPDKRGVAMVFQDAALYPYLTVRGNLAFPLKKLPADQREERVLETSRLLGIEELLDRKPHELSGGEAQRVALGRGLASRPKALLLDEPLASLDPPLRTRLRREIARLQQATGVTMLHVTHDQHEALALADHLVVMDHGRVRQQGPPAELYEQPANRFVASFLGSPGMNLIKGEVCEGRFVAAGGFDVDAGDAPIGPAYLGIRPEDLACRDAMSKELSGAMDSSLRVEGFVEHCETLGRETLIYLGAEMQHLTLRVNDACPVPLGEMISVWLRPGARFHLFGADEESRRLGEP